MGSFAFGVAGLGGFAQAVTNGILESAASDPSAPQLAAACDPDLQRTAERAEFLRGKGVKVLSDFGELLKEPIDAVWLPVPIALHRPFTEQAVNAGKAVIVEKPAAGTLEEVDAMIAARDRTKRPVAVGFQLLFDPSTWAIKRKLLAGAIGRPRSASVFGCWPRGSVYYKRNTWAGKVRIGDTVILDSPANNAMAHYLNLALFLLGPTERESATPVQVEAELYRANDIENYDTCTLRYTMADGAKLTVAMTHACGGETSAAVDIGGESGSVHYDSRAPYRLRTAEGVEEFSLPHNLSRNVIRQFAAYVQGDPKAEYASLENARVHTLAVTAASRATEVVTIDPAHIQEKPFQHGTIRFIPGIEAALRRCADTGQLLSESGQAPWATPGGTLKL